LSPINGALKFEIKVTGYPATVEQIFYYVIEVGLGVVA